MSELCKDCFFWVNNRCSLTTCCKKADITVLVGEQASGESVEMNGKTFTLHDVVGSSAERFVKAQEDSYKRRIAEMSSDDCILRDMIQIPQNATNGDVIKWE